MPTILYPRWFQQLNCFSSSQYVLDSCLHEAYTLCLKTKRDTHFFQVLWREWKNNHLQSCLCERTHFRYLTKVVSVNPNNKCKLCPVTPVTRSHPANNKNPDVASISYTSVFWTARRQPFFLHSSTFIVPFLPETVTCWVPEGLCFSCTCSVACSFSSLSCKSQLKYSIFRRYFP